ncbi:MULTISPECIES: tripartite tricarboxylate transporter substrate binding protein [unclassified Paenibacillus]|uniref:tripartite tricarboxylate transporter substrate binding protein n=1 Tax=unclassified Paenibacillus TaxID=185978 RepID=UPI001AE83C34|nr:MULTISPECIES: tripartite tricarboxylate transporter substrate binding protein [unclassified Paenibacillus]MBP1156950.1 putative tricarboxylic transport membrane protein [Paenibacillus sp. PvP091]MBP1172311.1 putative tricarboxylic transport membrane protein [Paenibacillus sp. PvR098]MBP2438692.1 putative tricarboxylic transport membrane protein [Paenibacillus sp. PvP052]
MKKSISVVLSSLIAVSLVTACSSKQTAAPSSGGGDNTSSNQGNAAPAPAGFVPAKDIEFVVPYSPGGGSDINARTLAQVIKNEKLVDKNMVIVNKPGGTGAVGNAYTFSKKGDPHTIMTWVSGQQAATVVNKAEVSLKDLTPIATMALDSFLVLVKANSPYQTFDDLVKAAKEKPEAITIGGAGATQEDYLIYHLINKHAGAKLKYVTFNSGGEAMTALMGGHVDVVSSNPNEVIAQIEAGELRALAATSEERLASPLDQVSSFKELGYPGIQLTQFRAIAGPPDMPQEAVKYWEGVFKKVSESADWQENYIKKYHLKSEFKNAEESKKYFEEALNMYLEIHKEAGTIK